MFAFLSIQKAISILKQRVKRVMIQSTTSQSKSISCSNTSRNNETKFLCSSVPSGAALTFNPHPTFFEESDPPRPYTLPSFPGHSALVRLSSWGFVLHGLLHQPLLQPESLILSDNPTSRIVLGSCVSESLFSQLHPIHILIEIETTALVSFPQDITNTILLLPVNLSSCQSTPWLSSLRTLPSVEMVQEIIIPVSPLNHICNPFISYLLSG